MEHTLPILREDQGTLLFYCISGSRAYGTDLPDSDTDYRGIFGWGIDRTLSLSDPVNTISGSSLEDSQLYSLRMTLNYALSGKFGMAEILFSPSDCILYTNPLFNTILDNRDQLLSKQWFQGIRGYFKSQLMSLSAKGIGSSLGRLRDKYRVGPPSHVDEQYDGKFALHAVRLGQVGLDLASDGSIIVRRPNAEFLKGVLDGSIFPTRSALVSYLRELDQALLDVSTSSSLSDCPDYGFWDSLYRGIEKSL